MNPTCRDVTFNVTQAANTITINHLKFHCITPLFGFLSLNATINSQALSVGTNNILIGTINNIPSQFNFTSNWYKINNTLKYRFSINNNILLITFDTTTAQLVNTTINVCEHYEITNTSAIPNYAMMW